MRSMLLGLILLLPASALAEPIETQKIITALTGDFNGDGVADLAMIVETEPEDGTMDMHFFLRDKKYNFLKPAGIVHEQVYGEWNDYDQPHYEGSGIEPELTALPNGSIKISLPGLIGPGERTDMTLTIAWRNEAFVVAGVAYDHYKYQSVVVDSSCDYDVLTGKGKSMQTQDDDSKVNSIVSVEGQVVPFAEWDTGTPFRVCGD
ncbi:hypothetical protein NKI88_15220 [Mesorhizobium sp. M0317]|uniref:hypothetical protein n=1 Tax=Mesorhizobium sp. M0317 TaxID=2956935 RepID=UPI00333D9144